VGYVGQKLGPLGHHHRVHLEGEIARFPKEPAHFPKERGGGDVPKALIIRGEVLADVAQRRGPQQSVTDRVQEHVGIGMASQAELERDLHSPEHEPPPRGKPVEVDPYAYSDVCPFRHKW
jgi:hypothetical protein